MLNGSLAAVLQAAAHVAFIPSSGVAVTALAVCVLACALTACVLTAAWLGRVVAATPMASRVAALREKSRRAAFLPQRDPDAAGRPRPRAPSRVPAAALPAPTSH
ncbi:MAG TPA: DUF6412 domain-containing protein [Streptosporangiaceae bacterium]|nr:DUF6412 domain-containing protein [Streptosporangiaceae bacterium]